MAYQRTSETIKIESLKIHKKRRLERFVSGQDVSLFEPTESGKFEYMVSERQTTKPTNSQINLNIELKSQNSQANRSITFLKDSDTSLWRSQANFFFCLDELNRRNQASKTYMPNCRVSTCRLTCQLW